MPVPSWSLWIRRTKDIAIILTCLSIIVSIVVTLLGLRDGWRRDRLAGFDQSKKIFESDFTIRDDIFRFLHVEPTLPKPRAMLATYGSGRAMYYAEDDNLRHFRNACHHYEEVGALVKAGYVDFDLYYQIVPFPRDFWNSTEELRQTIGANWDGPDRPLPDFLANFADLGRRYDRQR